MDKLAAGDPRNIGPYRPLARLGSGGLGQVFLARSGDGHTAAVRLIRRELADQAAFRESLRQEVAAARRVAGAWTVRVVDADLDADEPWVASEYIAGPTLLTLVSGDGRGGGADRAGTRPGPLPPRSVRVLASGLAHALRDIHAAGVVHRDLKPSNILITEQGPRVADFGIARALDAATQGGQRLTGALTGSPGFMSPEQVRGETATPAGDIFSLGSVLTYATTGRLPFGATDSSPHALQLRITQEEPDTTGLTPGLAQLVRECLRKNPAERPSTNAILDRVGAPDATDGAWLPGGVLADVGQHTVRLSSARSAAAAGAPEADAGSTAGTAGTAAGANPGAGTAGRDGKGGDGTDSAVGAVGTDGWSAAGDTAIAGPGAAAAAAVAAAGNAATVNEAAPPASLPGAPVPPGTPVASSISTTRPATPTQGPLPGAPDASGTPGPPAAPAAEAATDPAGAAHGQTQVPPPGSGPATTRLRPVTGATGTEPGAATAGDPSHPGAGPGPSTQRLRPITAASPQAASPLPGFSSPTPQEHQQYQPHQPHQQPSPEQQPHAQAHAQPQQPHAQPQAQDQSQAQPPSGAEQFHQGTGAPWPPLGPQSQPGAPSAGAAAPDAQETSVLPAYGYSQPQPEVSPQQPYAYHPYQQPEQQQYGGAEAQGWTQHPQAQQPQQQYGTQQPHQAQQTQHTQQTHQAQHTQQAQQQYGYPQAESGPAQPGAASGYSAGSGYGYPSPQPYQQPQPYQAQLPSQAPQHNPSPAPAPAPGYGYPPQQPSPQDAGGVLPPPTGPGFPSYDSGFGPDRRPDPDLDADEPPRSRRGTIALIAVALVVAVGAGGAVYGVMNGGGSKDGKAAGSVSPSSAGTGGRSGSAPSAATTPSDSDSASPSTSPSAKGDVPQDFVGTWSGGIQTKDGFSPRTLVIRQGKVGDAVLSLTADGAKSGKGGYHCEFRASLASTPTGDKGPLRIGPSSVAVGQPMSSCTPGAATTLSIQPNGSLRRVTGTGEALTYKRQ
ncbi:serine/threonine-protein kinase [Streptomyces fuscigenes]|uniref:serine/threonine-protein kinase n=1 Tax=Streptomyces fuscigenes TaxID=1528880 RepID=UPI001F45CD4F|nr:serine/threonine-protein kinase [Streptomyces fuscigenes]MCF3962202.1 protein kinase [Streptomyces fuscigenes]